MLNLVFGGQLRVSGTWANLERFITEALNGTLSEDEDRFVFQTYFQDVKGAHSAYIAKKESSQLICQDSSYVQDQENVWFVSVFYCQRKNIITEDLVRLSKEYHVNFSMYADIRPLLLSRYIIISNGKVVRNEYIDWMDGNCNTGDQSNQDTICDTEESAKIPSGQTESKEIFHDMKYTGFEGVPI